MRETNEKNIKEEKKVGKNDVKLKVKVNEKRGGSNKEKEGKLKEK